MKRRKFIATAVAAVVAPKVVPSVTEEHMGILIDNTSAAQWIDPAWETSKHAKGYFKIMDGIELADANPDPGFVWLRRMTEEEIAEAEKGKYEWEDVEIDCGGFEVDFECDDGNNTKL